MPTLPSKKTMTLAAAKAIGVSGAKPGEDVQVGQAGIDAFLAG